jgi:hypothetical protein
MNKTIGRAEVSEIFHYDEKFTLMNSVSINKSSEISEL